MRLSHDYSESILFQFDEFKTFLRAIHLDEESVELEQARKLFESGLPPIVSRQALTTMLGIHVGLLWSIRRNTSKYYREFSIMTGTKRRVIHSPRVVLKIIQKWLSIQLSKAYVRPNHVFGFCPTLSHLDAAAVHLGAEWVVSVDIESFFSNVSRRRVQWAFKRLGYSSNVASILSEICCYNGALPQGAPSSPVLSNLCAYNLDSRLQIIERRYGCNVSRYADDITFSGKGELPERIISDIKKAVQKERWTVASHKTKLMVTPHRRKVHGLLVHGDTLRLTKGYRNKLRAFEHVLKRDNLTEEDFRKLNGHLEYAKSILKFNTKK